MKRRLAVRGIFVHNGKFLAVKLKPYNRHSRQDFWCTIGGGVDDDEVLTDAIVREITEETGIHPDVGHLLYVHEFVDSGTLSTEFFFFIKNAADYAHINLANTTHGQLEIAEFDFIDQTEPSLLPKFLQTIDLDSVHQTQAVQFFSYIPQQ